LASGGGRATIASSFPTHEPYHHPINAATGSGSKSATIKRADGSTTTAVIAADNSTLRDISGFKVSDKVNQCIYQASQRTGVPYANLMAISAQESSFKADAGSTHAGAKGLFQFEDSTWQQTYDRYGPNGTVSKNAGVTNNVFDPCSNALLGAYYYKENSASLSAAGLPNGPTDVYVTHLLGPSGGKKFLRAVASSPDAANTVGNNPAIFKSNGTARTNQAAYNLLNSKIGATVPQWTTYQATHAG